MVREPPSEMRVASSVAGRWISGPRERRSHQGWGGNRRRRCFCFSGLVKMRMEQGKERPWWGAANTAEELPRWGAFCAARSDRGRGKRSAGRKDGIWGFCLGSVGEDDIWVRDLSSVHDIYYRMGIVFGLLWLETIL